MKLICKQEAKRQDGTKIMEFTKGKTYEAESEIEDDTTSWRIKDDNGKTEKFWHLAIMFKIADNEQN